MAEVTHWISGSASWPRSQTVSPAGAGGVIVPGGRGETGEVVAVGARLWQARRPDLSGQATIPAGRGA